MSQYDVYYQAVLRFLAGSGSWHRRDIIAAVVKQLHLPREEAEALEQGPIGKDIAGHVTHTLKRAGLIEREKAVCRITSAGELFLAQHQEGITRAMVTALPTYKAYVPKRRA